MMKHLPILFLGLISILGKLEAYPTAIDVEDDKKKWKFDFGSDIEYSKIKEDDAKSLLSEYLMNIATLEGTSLPPSEPPPRKTRGTTTTTIPPTTTPNPWPLSPILVYPPSQDSYHVQIGSEFIPSQGANDIHPGFGGEFASQENSFTSQNVNNGLQIFQELIPITKPSKIRRPRKTTTTTTNPPSMHQVVAVVETKPSRKPLTGVDSIEDAILAALETAASQNQNTTPKKLSTRADVAGMKAFQQNPSASGDVGVNVNRQYVVVPVPINQEGLVNGQILQLAPVGVSTGGGVAVGADGELPATTKAPGEFIAGIFGSLAQANLAGIADNTFKLLASSGVQNFFVGLADQVTCQFSADNCNKKTKEAQQPPRQ